mgnify:CR=1 FL=1
MSARSDYRDSESRWIATMLVPRTTRRVAHKRRTVSKTTPLFWHEKLIGVACIGFLFYLAFEYCGCIK